MKSDIVLSLQAYTFRDRSLADTLKTAERLGYKYLESYPGQAIGGGIEGNTDYNSMKPETLQQLKAMLDKSPVKVVSYGVTGAGSTAQWAKLMTFAKTLGIKEIQIEAGQDKAAYDLAEQAAEQYQIRVSLHNHTQEKGLPQAMLESLKGRGRLIGAGADIGHWVRAGANALEGVKLLKGKFLELHLVDVGPKEAGYRDIPLGSGISDIKGILDELSTQGGTIYATVEYELQSDNLEADVAACARWFHAWEQGKIGANQQLAVGNLASLWRGIRHSAKPDTWDLPKDIKGATELAKKTAAMKRLEVNLDSVKGNAPGSNDREGPKSAFGDNRERKYCQPWKGGAWVSCALVAAGTPKVYTVSSSNDGETRDPVEWILKGSEDGEHWFELDHLDKQRFMGRYCLKGFEIKNPRKCQYLKFEVLKHLGDRDFQFSRLGFFE